MGDLQRIEPVAAFAPTGLHEFLQGIGQTGAQHAEYRVDFCFTTRIQADCHGSIGIMIEHAMQ